MTRSAVVLTVVGADQPGIVHRLSEAVADAGGNWERSEMSRLADQFAGIVQVSVDDDRLDEMIEGLEACSDEALHVHVVRSDGDAESEVDITRHVLSVVGTDRPGIVSQVAEVLAGAGIGVSRMDTNVVEAAHGGGRVFRAKMGVDAVSIEDLEVLAEGLQHIAADIMVDIEQVG